MRDRKPRVYENLLIFPPHLNLLSFKSSQNFKIHIVVSPPQRNKKINKNTRLKKREIYTNLPFFLQPLVESPLNNKMATNQVMKLKEETASLTLGNCQILLSLQNLNHLFLLKNFQRLSTVLLY